MNFSSVLKLNLMFIFFVLTGCNPYIVETSYDELRKTNACSLKHNLLKMHMSWGASYLLSIDLTTVDSNIVFADICLSGGSSIFFRDNTEIVFKVTKKDNNIEEINIKYLNSVKNKTKVGYQVRTESHLSIEMTRLQILEIANAEKVELIMQTINEPTRDVLDKDALQPFREFVSTCLSK